MTHIEFENKGVLIPVYFVVSAILSSLILRAFYRVFINEVIPESFGLFVGGFSFLVTSLWTHLTKHEYYTDKDGNKKILEMRHSFCWIKMDYWVYIFLVAGLGMMLASIEY